LNARRRRSAESVSPPGIGPALCPIVQIQCRVVQDRVFRNHGTQVPIDPNPGLPVIDNPIAVNSCPEAGNQNAIARVLDCIAYDHAKATARFDCKVRRLNRIPRTVL
jgi:hypothetical protein